ncbi:Protein unc-93 A [Blattella germanica]|nr:Protein unc-93 A [Blattella germanica]
MAGFWGLCDGAWLVGVNAMYGILFPNDVAAAYSNFRLWEAFGYALGYSNGVWLCINIQLYFLIGLLVIGMAGYIDTEFRHQKVRRTPPQTDLSMQAQEQ